MSKKIDGLSDAMRAGLRKETVSFPDQPSPYAQMPSSTRDSQPVVGECKIFSLQNFC